MNSGFEAPKTELIKLHETLLVIMDEIDRICTENDIQYFLDSGTALGAIRHGGFIPWDDDFDIGMLRDDYNKFIEIAKTGLKEGFFLQNHQTDENYYKFNSKVRLDNTFFPENGGDNLGHKGIYIDIFPFDYLPDDNKKALSVIKISRKMVRKVFFTRKEYHFTGIKKVISMGYHIHSHEYYRLKYERFITKLNKVKTNNVTCFSYHMIREKDILFNVEDICPSKRIQFENRLYLIMNNPDNYLRAMYGDYMQLPPKEKRICHLDGKIIFDIKSN